MRFLIEHLQKSYGKKQVLRDVDFAFESGKIYGLLGRNGAGKTTLFNCLNHDIKSDAGAFWLEEDGQRRPLKAADIGYVLSTPVVPEFLTGWEFVKFFTEIAGQPEDAEKTPDHWLDLVGIDAEDRQRLMKDYSHGMKNKMQMLCFLIAKPPIILLDEPLTSFDVVAAKEMKDLLLDMKRDHIILFSTHILQLAADLCDEITILSQGLLEEVDPALIHTPAFEERVVALLKDEDAHE